MQYTFEGKKIVDGNRTFLDIPFNVWDITGCTGNIPVKVDADGILFECKLIPKGNGRYYIPVKKAIAGKLKETFEVSLEVVDTLSRINHNSPYSKEHPIRVIDSIEEIKIAPGYCGHCCVAMLAGVSLQDVLQVMGKSESSWSKIMETLDYYGIPYASKMVYPKGKNLCMPKCCIVYMDGEFMLWHEGRYYGSEVSEPSRIISYLEIAVHGMEEHLSVCCPVEQNSQF